MTATDASRTHLVLIPSYNAGPAAVATVRAARERWNPIWVVVDGSTDGSAGALQAFARERDGVRVFVLDRNQGKGAAMLHGMRAALAEGFTHALAMDSDGQHPADLIASFMQRSIQAPDAMILGKPVFDASAPLLRVRGRKVSNAWTRLETFGAGIGDSLYGFRVYPLRELASIMERSRFMRRFDFDVEAVVRLAWRGVRAINVDAPVRYPSKEEGGVSHFRYVRDNVLLTGMHARLMLGFLWRLPVLIARRVVRRAP